MFAIITWSPDPIITEIGGFALRWYSVLFATGFVIGFLILRKLFEAEKVSMEVLDKMLLYSVVGTIFGARIGNCLFYDFDYFSQHPAEILLPFKFSPEFHFTGFRGLASHGAMFGLLLAYWLLSRQTGKSMLWFLDKASIIAPLCLACIRMGNFMNSEIMGDPTDLPWAIIYSQVDDIPRHPVQLYDFLIYMTIFLFILRHNKSSFGKVKDGYLFGVFLLLTGVMRICVEFIKEDYVILDGFFNMAQYLSLPMIVGGLILIIKMKEPKEVD